MFEFVRTHNRLLQVVLALLIFPSFILIGVQGFTHLFSNESLAVAEVDGHDITKSEWDAEHRQNAERVRQQNPKVDPKQLDTLEARRQSLNGLVRERVLQAAVFHENILVSDESLAYVLRSVPQFAMYSNADQKTREALASAQGLTAAGFEQRVRDDIARNHVLQGVSDSGLIAPAVTRTALDALLERREVQWQPFESKAYLDKVQPSDADVVAYYNDKAHAPQFRAPEEAQIEYVVLDLAALKGQATVTEEQLRDYYKSNISRYTVAEERRASHILVKVDAGASGADKDKAKAKAEALLAEVRKNPGSFAEVAKKNSDDPGSAGQGGDLDYFGHGAMAGPFDAAVFAMKQGEISNVVQTEFGFHIIELTGIRGGTAKTFEEVRPQLEDEVRKQLAQKRYTEIADQFSNLVYEQSDSLQPAIDKFHLGKQTATVQRHVQPGAAGPLAFERLLESIFSGDSVRTKHNTEAIETAPSTLVSARIVQYKAEHQVPLADVKEVVLQRVRLAQAAAAARKDGEARLAALRKDPSDTLPQTATVSRAQATAVPRQLLDAALKADVAKGPAVSGVDLGDGGFIVLKVVKALPRDPAEPQTEGAKSLVEQSLSDAEAQAFYEALKSRYKVKVNDARVAHAGDAPASASK